MASFVSVTGFCLTLCGTGPLSLVFLLLVDEIYLRRTDVDDFWASISVLFEDSALETVKCISDPSTTTNNALALAEDDVKIVQR